MNNYNFKDNWEEIKKRLDYPIVQRIIHSTIKKYFRDTLNRRKYNKNYLPIYYAQVHHEFIEEENITEEEEDELRERLTINGIIEKDENAPNFEKILKKCRNNKTKADEKYDEKMEDYYNSSKGWKYDQYCEEVMKPYIDYIMKNNYKSYCLYGGCHFWNKSFCLKMATYIYPKEKWEIVSNHLHTTIVNKSRTKVFDILMYDENADDFGGDEAYKYATFEGTKDEWFEQYNNLQNPTP